MVRRERRGTSHGVSIRVGRGLYYRPSTFRSRPIEWEETVHADKGLLGLTTKHIHFAGSRKRSRVRHDRIVAFDPHEDGSGTTRDAQTAKAQAFRSGGSWFAYNLNQSQGGIYICGAMKIGLGATVKLFQMYLKGGPTPPLDPPYAHPTLALV